jgi:streptogramin lyase
VVWFTNQFENTIGRITGARGMVKQFAGEGISSPRSIIAFSGALWFTNARNDSIGRITTAGQVTNYRGEGIREPHGITAGPDGSLWFTNYGNNSIGRINPNTGQVTNYHEEGAPDRPKISNPESIVSGPDGALWFTNTGIPSIGRITTDGNLSIYYNDALGIPTGLTVGSDGALWATNRWSNSIDRVTTDGVITTFRGEGIDKPERITGGWDGALWFTNLGNKTIGRITTAGVVTTFGADKIPSPGEIANGPAPQRPLWFSVGVAHTLGRMSSIFESAGPPATTPDHTPEMTAATSAPPETAPPPAVTRCDITLTNRAGAPVRLSKTRMSAGDVWDPAPTDEIPNDATLRWASSDAPPGACRNDTDVALRRDGADVTWHVALTLGSDKPELSCTTSDDDYPCTIVRTKTDGDRQVSVTVTLRRRTP